PDEHDKPPIENVLHSSMRVLRRRKVLAFLVLAASVIPAAVFVMRRPPIYQATVRLLLERDDEMTSVVRNPVNDGVPPVDNFFQTQQQLLLGRPVIVRAIEQIKLWESPQFKRTLNANATPEDISRSDLPEQFLSHVTLTPVAGTHLLDITFDASD